jgi:hypothetical protein
MSELSDYEQTIVDNVEKHGCHLVGVFDPDAKDPRFDYSVGFTKTLEKVGKSGFPEAIVFGLPGEVSGPALNELMALCAGGFVRLEDGERLERFFGEYDAIIRTVHPSWIDERYFSSAIWYHRKQMNREFQAAVMVVWPDEEGVFPWEDGCAEWVRADQPALYSSRLNS